jgi:hypothetical protein
MRFASVVLLLVALVAYSHCEDETTVDTTTIDGVTETANTATSPIVIETTTSDSGSGQLFSTMTSALLLTSAVTSLYLSRA